MRVLDGISMVVRILSASEGRPTKEDMDERACRLRSFMQRLKDAGCSYFKRIAEE